MTNTTTAGLVGESDAMCRVRALVDRVAPTETSVLVVGESGTGRGLVARALHAGSTHELRADARFVAATNRPPAVAIRERRLRRESLHVRIGSSRLTDVERSVIEATLDHFAGNKRRAADVLGRSVKTLYNKLNRCARLAGVT